MWAVRAQRFPEHTPPTREYYLLRSIFETHFPSPSALATVPKVPDGRFRTRVICVVTGLACAIPCGDMRKLLSLRREGQDSVACVL